VDLLVAEKFKISVIFDGTTILNGNLTLIVIYEPGYGKSLPLRRILSRTICANRFTIRETQDEQWKNDECDRG